MKNIISSIIISSVLSFAQAKNIQDSFEAQIATNKVSSISQSDMDFLFNNPNEVNVALLDSQEMKETKG